MDGPPSVSLESCDSLQCEISVRSCVWVKGQRENELPVVCCICLNLRTPLDVMLHTGLIPRGPDPPADVESQLRLHVTSVKSEGHDALFIAIPPDCRIFLDQMCSLQEIFWERPGIAR